MPQQELFFEATSGETRLEVVKTYDQSYARDAFSAMDDTSQLFLRRALKLDEKYDAGDLPGTDDPSASDFLWEELCEAAREDGNRLSFFIVNQGDRTNAASIFVAPDWPSAEAFAKLRAANAPE